MAIFISITISAKFKLTPNISLFDTDRKQHEQTLDKYPFIAYCHTKFENGISWYFILAIFISITISAKFKLTPNISLFDTDRKQHEQTLDKYPFIAYCHTKFENGISWYFILAIFISITISAKFKLTPNISLFDTDSKQHEQTLDKYPFIAYCHTKFENGISWYFILAIFISITISAKFKLTPNISLFDTDSKQHEQTLDKYPFIAYCHTKFENGISWYFILAIFISITISAKFKLTPNISLFDTDSKQHEQTLDKYPFIAYCHTKFENGISWYFILAIFISITISAKFKLTPNISLFDTDSKQHEQTLDKYPFIAYCHTKFENGISFWQFSFLSPLAPNLN